MYGIKIANLLLTRRCNLRCSYCRISANIAYENSPYPTSHCYYEKEQPIGFWIELCKNLLDRNPGIFFIIYGGEPLLRNDLPDLIKFLNSENADYTIISNCTPETNKNRDRLIREVGKLRGFTASVDPVLVSDKKINSHINSKTQSGFSVLCEMKNLGVCDDLVAEITCTNDNIHLLETTVDRLSSLGIWSDVTVLDDNKDSKWYDFSNVSSTDNLVEKNYKTAEIFYKLIHSDYKIHAKEKLLPLIYDILPSNMKCELDQRVRNITIDSDGTLRLCLRIRGYLARSCTVEDLFDRESMVYNRISHDYDKYCRGCSWTCMLMSNSLTYEDISTH